MKKLIPFLVLFCVMTLSVSALVTYTGQPSLPYIIYGHVDWQSQALGGARIELTNTNTGYSTIIRTNVDGYWQEEGSNWLSSSSARPPIMFGDIINIKSLDGCGTNDMCSKSFSAFSSGFENFAVINHVLSGVIVVTIVSKDDSSLGDRGSGGGGGGGSASPAWNCEAWTKCVDGTQVKLCKLGEFTSKETKTCVPEPTPIVTEPITPIKSEIPFEPKTYSCTDGTIVNDLSECIETRKQVEDYVKNNTGYYVGGSVIGIGFIALVIYWIKRNRARAKKMIDTRIANIKKK